MWTADTEAARERAIGESGILNRVRDLELANVVASACRRYGTPLGALTILTGRRQIVLGAFGTSITETRREDAICSLAIQRPGEPLIISDAALDHRVSGSRLVRGDPHVRFYAGMPIVDLGGYALGALCVADTEPRSDPFDPTELMWLARNIEGMLR